MAAFIDPAQSFSNALNQGLGIMKSYRDEARLDEDRAFDRMMKERIDNRAERASNIADEENVRRRTEFKEWEKFAPFREQKTKAEADLGTAQAKDAGILANNRQKMIDTDIGVAWSNAKSSRIAAQAAASNAATNRRQADLQWRQYNDAQKREQTVSFNKALLGAIQSNDPSKIANNPGVARQAASIIGMAVNAPALAEAIQNPFGNWRNDPNKVAQILPFAQINIGKTAESRGFRGKGARVVNFTTEKVKGSNGKEEVKLKFGIEGVNKRTGRKEVFWAYQSPEKFLDKATVFQKTFNTINNDPQARLSLTRAYETSDPEGFDTIMNREWSMREEKAQAIKRQLEGGVGFLDRNTKAQLQSELAMVNREMYFMQKRDPVFMSSLLFESLGRIHSMR